MLTHFTDWILDGGYLPHPVIRVGIRRQLADRISQISSLSLAEAYERKMEYIELLRTRPIAVETAKANTQHCTCPRRPARSEVPWLAHTL